MGAYNSVYGNILCPHHKAVVRVEAQAKFGYRQQFNYEVGDRVEWWEGDPRAARPPGGNADVDGYVVCDVCGRDFWTTIQIRSDRVVAIEPVPSRPGLDRGTADDDDP